MSARPAGDECKPLQLRSRTDLRRATEVDVAVHAPNRMLELGRPISVCVARTTAGLG